MSRISKIVEEYGIDPNGKKVIKLHFECDTVSDLPTTAEAATANIVMALGSDAHIIQDDTKYMIKGDGVWVKQKGEFELSLDAAAIDYDNTTSGMAADNIQDAIDEIHAATETQGTAISGLQTQNTSQQNEIDYAINTGAKNILNIVERSRVHNGVTFTVNSDESVSISGATTGSNSFMRLTGTQTSTVYSVQVPLPKGRYKISCPGALSTDNFRFAVGYRNTSTDSRSTITAQQSNDFEAEFEITTDTGRFDATILSVSTDSDYSATVYPMIRRVEITDDTFEPYAPSNRELYEMILQLQSAAGLRTVSTLRSAAAPLKNKTEEEVTEDEER